MYMYDLYIFYDILSLPCLPDCGRSRPGSGQDESLHHTGTERSRGSWSPSASVVVTLTEHVYQ